MKYFVIRFLSGFYLLIGLATVLPLSVFGKKDSNARLGVTPKGNIPQQNSVMGFEENKGQFVDEKGKPLDNLLYKFKAKGTDVYLTKNGVSYIFYRSSHKHIAKVDTPEVVKGDSVVFNRVDIDLVGANIDEDNIIAEKPLVTEINYFKGNVLAGITGVKQYQKITIKNVYKGIDWVWYVNGNSEKIIKYDFIVHPFADPGNIKMLYKWADVSINNGNEVSINTPIGNLNEGKAVSYVNNEEIKTNYIVNGNLITYDIETYDKSQTLIIDPPLNLIWGTYFGGDAFEKNSDVSNAIDAAGNVFVVGNTSAANNFPTINPGGGAYFQGTLAGGFCFEGKGGDIFVTKFSNSGALIWCTYYGGTDHDNGNSVTIDNNGNVYVVGSSLSTDFPINSQTGSYNQATLAGGSNDNDDGGDAVLIKFSNSGVLLWATYYGGAANDIARSVVTDGSGNVYMTGWTQSTDFPLNNPGGGAYYQATNGGAKDAFIVKFGSNGAQLWSTYYGGTQNDIAHYITSGSSGSNYIVGETNSSNFPTNNPGGGAYFQATNGGLKDAFIIKIGSNCASQWSTYYGGLNDDIGRGITCNSYGEVFATGQTKSTNFPLLNPGGGAYFQGAKAGSPATYDSFYGRFQSNGVLFWSTYFGGSQDEDGAAIVTDACGNIYATGNTYSTDLPLANPGSGAFYVNTNQFMDDVYFVSFAYNSSLVWSTYNGTTGFDEKGTSLKVDQFGHLFVVGYWCFYSNSNAQMNATGAYNKQNTDGDDLFIVKFNIANCQQPSYSTSICFGTTTVITMPNPNNLTSPVYSMQPGPVIQSSPNFTISPSVNSTYTLFITGTNSVNSTVTNSMLVNVTVNPAPVLTPLINQGTCASPANSINIAVTFTPSSSTNYTTTWSPFPASYSSVNSATASGLIPGPNSATVTNSFGCTAIVNFTINPVPLPADFIIINPSNDYTITCSNLNVLLTTSVTNGNPLTYVWSPCSSTVTGPSYNFTAPCIGQVVGTSSTGCSVVRTFTVFQDITAPLVAVSPSVMNITCGMPPGTFTGTSNMGPNVTTNWFQLVGTTTVYVGVAQGTINVFSPGQPGVYWFESVYNITGCRTTQSVLVTASVGVPVFTVTSSTSFTIGCSTKSITSMQVTSVITSPVPNVAVNYTFMTPPVTGTPTTFTINPNLNNITIPGTYVVYIKDLTNNCVSSQSISIIQNTIQPSINFIQPLPILTCRDASMVLSGISSNTNTQITWTVPAFPGSSVNPTPNATVNINPAITGATNNVTAIGVWTVGAVDNNNFCSAIKTVQINQDIRLPKFTISALSNSVINCKNSDVVIVPVVTPSLAVALVPTYFWYPPIGSGIPGTQFNTTVPGTHSCVSTSVVNGCTYSAIYNVAVDFAPPSLLPSSAFTLGCSTPPSATLFPNINGSVNGLTYQWQVPVGALVSNLTASAIVTNVTGDYIVVVTNTVNGCVSQAGYDVMDGKIEADFIPSAEFGYAPLSVTFFNTSSTSTGSSNIISTWGYGNGAVTQTVYNTMLASAVYTASGTYSVILKVRKGNCIDTKVKIIQVDLPSKMEVPNVFTPNGDKSNDIFKLRATNLAEIEIFIFDRWGTKVYELLSDTGNFAWDGKSPFGQDCAAGIYFYVIKAKGKDGLEFEQKGNVSLFR